MSIPNRKQQKKQEVVSGIRCPDPKCNAIVWSIHRHDMRYCPCGYCYVDGGRDYTRVGWGYQDGTSPHGGPVSIDVDTSTGLEVSSELTPTKARKKKTFKAGVISAG